MKFSGKNKKHSRYKEKRKTNGVYMVMKVSSETENLETMITLFPDSGSFPS